MKTLKDFQSKFCEDCTGACQGMCYGFISAEDQFRNYKVAEFMKNKEILIWCEDGKFFSEIVEEINHDVNGKKVIFNVVEDDYYQAFEATARFIREKTGADIDSE